MRCVVKPLAIAIVLTNSSTTLAGDWGIGEQWLTEVPAVGDDSYAVRRVLRGRPSRRLSNRR